MPLKSTKQGTPTTQKALMTSFLVDCFDLVSNIVVAIITGSVIVLAEAMQGLADLCSVALLLIGHKRSRKKADTKHQFGYGKELYFWALLAAVVILLITATLSVYFGLQKFLHPEPVEWTLLAYIVLLVAISTNLYAFGVSARRLLEGKSFAELPKTFAASPLLAPKTTTILDAMGAVAALFGLINLSIYSITGDARFDGVGAMAIGAVLAFFATMLLIGIRGFVAGRSVPPAQARKIRQVAGAVQGVQEVLGLRTMLLGSESTLVIIDVHLADNLKTDDIEIIIDHIQHAVIQAVPGDTQVQVEIETPTKSK